MTEKQPFEHRLSRGCDNCAMLRVVRMMGRKQPYI
ncbi:cation transporter, partial [Enterococcus faecium]